jgi:hypothetical protein
VIVGVKVTVGGVPVIVSVIVGDIVCVSEIVLVGELVRVFVHVCVFVKVLEGDMEAVAL